MVFIREEAAGRRLHALHCGGRYGHEQNHRPSGAARQQLERVQALVQRRWQPCLQALLRLAQALVQPAAHAPA